MKRWMLVMGAIALCSMGIAIGIISAQAIWAIGFTTGHNAANTELVLDTQAFKDAVDGGKEFRRGDYTFVPCRNPRTVKVRNTAGTRRRGEGGAER